MQALVYKSTGNWYQLKNEQGRVLSARMAGKLKTEGITSSNPIAVGDNVTINDEAGEEKLGYYIGITQEKLYQQGISAQ